MSKREYLYAGLAGLGMLGMFLSLKNMFPPVPATEGPKRRLASGPIVIAPARGLISGEDTHRVQAKLRASTGPVDLVIHAYGGYVVAVDSIIHALRAYKGGRIHAYIPYYAFSGGTMIALAANKIIMGQGAVLGPVDPQLAGFAAADLMQLTEQKSIDQVDDQFVLMGDLARKTYKETRELVAQLVKSQAAFERLTSGTSSHANPIPFAEALQLQLPVEEGVPEQYYRLLDGRLKLPQFLFDL